jgi:hypothetical protein
VGTKLVDQRGMHVRSIIGVVGLVGVAAAGDPLPDRDGGVEFVTVGDPGNAAYDGMDPQGFVAGRGSVDDAYRIGRTEITTQNWVDFLNAMRFTEEPFFMIPVEWGAIPVQAVPYWRFEPFSDESATWQLGGLGWRHMALYCNWLHHGRPIGIENVQDGAYDAGTFTADPVTGQLSDQATRSPGARFWIPSLDEWIKAMHYDPDRNGPGQGGWWLYPYGSDDPPVPGLPSDPEAETSGGTEMYFPLGQGAFEIPLMSYEGSESPWGAMDASGAGEEWTETWDRPQRFGFLVRATYGSSVNTTPQVVDYRDAVYGFGNGRPNELAAQVMSGRIASAVPPAADFSAPWWQCTFSDVTGYLAAFVAGDSSADITALVGVLDTADLIAFVDAFAACR